MFEKTLEASIDGIHIHATSTGTNPKTVVLVHGWACDETIWSEQVPVLAKENTVITIDLPGHGKSGLPSEGKFSIDLFVQAIEAVRLKSKAEKIILAGHGMSTAVVIQYARLYPEHTSILALVDGPADKSTLREVNPEIFGGEEGMKNREKEIRDGRFNDATPSAVQDKIVKMMMAAPKVTAVGAAAAIQDPAIWKDDVLSIPTLAIYRDTTTSDLAEYMKNHFSRMEYHEITGTGHFIMLEKPDEFNDLLTKFMGENLFCDFRIGGKKCCY